MIVDGIVRDFQGQETGKVTAKGKVYDIVLGEPVSEIGFVKDGIAYVPKFGGDSTPIGLVEYY